MRNIGLDEVQAGIKIARRNIRNSDLPLLYFHGLFSALSFSHHHSGFLFPILTTYTYIHIYIYIYTYIYIYVHTHTHIYLHCFVYSLSHVRLCGPMDWKACQTSPSSTIYQRLLKFIFTESVMLSNHLILCHPLLFLSSIFPSIRVFSSESALHIRWPKVLELQPQSFQWILRVDFL